MTITQINSQRTIEENKTFIINNEPNRYLGTDGNSHIFYNEAKRSETKISNEDFMVLLER